MKHLSLLLLLFCIYISANGQISISQVAANAKNPPPIRTSQQSGSQDDPNQITAFCFQPGLTYTIWIEINGGDCPFTIPTPASPPTPVPSPFPTVVLATTATALLNTIIGGTWPPAINSNNITIIPGRLNSSDNTIEQAYEYSDSVPPPLETRYYPYQVSIGSSVPDSTLLAYYFIPNGNTNINNTNPLVCRDTVTAFFWISPTPCNSHHLISLDLSSGGQNGNGLEADAGPDISSGFQMSPSLLSSAQVGTWSGGRGTWQGNFYNPDSCEQANGAIIHAIWTVSDSRCKCSDVDEALLIIGGASIPTMTEWALICLTTLLIVVGVYIINSKLC